MAITLDTIVNKVFKVVKNGYDNNEVDSFLDEILEEMENREAEVEKLKQRIASLTSELERAKAQLSARPAEIPAAPVKPQPVVAPQPAPAKPAPERHSESFELVLSKAQSAYDEILAMAETRADDIVAKAEQEAAEIRTNAESQISDLKATMETLRKQTGEYYASLKAIVDQQTASMDQLKKML